ncbi:hypothetical protein GJU39_17490 [Pedobacter petrophilus]|uniref:BLUF domain-containing protein n=1 Tax=Pedobacter petrophilus TaxID=1908241 RepID=A0A7K0G3U4_9SPHI|nr:BLUF domain-containing protein [Pedobacter petrophilus]MRX77879.1 hypothetical protein [Pedobacter petrophilus]
MYSLLYTSTATEVMQPTALKEILRYSRSWNKDHHLTGCLAYIEGMLGDTHHCKFIQVLEGPENEVIALFKNIQKDSRHHSVTLIKQGKIEKRHFDSWEMGFEKMQLENNPILQDFFKLDPQLIAIHGTINNNMMMDFMRSFYDYL